MKKFIFIILIVICYNFNKSLGQSYMNFNNDPAYSISDLVLIYTGASLKTQTDFSDYIYSSNSFIFDGFLFPS